MWGRILRPLTEDSDINRWRDRTIEEQEWPCNAFGLRLDGLTCIDIDDPDICEDLRARALIPDTALVVCSISGGAHIYFAAELDYGAAPCARSRPDGWDLKSGGGHFMVGAGSHGYTVAQGGNSPLPPVSAATPILEALAEIAPTQAATLAHPPSSSEDHHTWTLTEIEDALVHIDPDQLAYGDWPAVCMAVHSTEPSEDARLLVDAWSQRRSEAHTNRSMPADKWASFAGRGTKSNSKLGTPHVSTRGARVVCV